MSSFSDIFTNKVDAKGRVSVPAKFRQLLAADGADFLVATRSLDLAALDCFGPSLRAELDARLAPLNPFSAEYDALAATYFAGSAELAWDQDGRITLPEQFIAHAKIADQVMFVGMGRKFQMWEPQAQHAYFERLRRQARENPGALSLRPAAGGSS